MATSTVRKFVVVSGNHFWGFYGWTRDVGNADTYVAQEEATAMAKQLGATIAAVAVVCHNGTPAAILGPMTVTA